jgi:hypothetical protein
LILNNEGRNKSFREKKREKCGKNAKGEDQLTLSEWRMGTWSMSEKGGRGIPLLL